MNRNLTRRTFLRNAAWAGSGLVILSNSRSLRGTPANSKLNHAGSGIGGRGAADIQGVAGENLVALCDVEEKQAAKTFEQHPDAKRFRDFRKMLDEMHSQIDRCPQGRQMLGIGLKTLFEMLDGLLFQVQFQVALGQ